MIATVNKTEGTSLFTFGIQLHFPDWELSSVSRRESAKRRAARLCREKHRVMELVLLHTLSLSEM